MPKNSTKRTAQRARQNSRKGKKGQPIRRRRHHQSGVAKGDNGLFTVKFTKKAAVDVDPCITGGSDLKVISDPVGETNRIYNDLKVAYLRYCKICKVASVLIPVTTVSLSKQIREMYNHIVQLAVAECKDARVNIEHNTAGDRYHFIIYYVYAYGKDVFTFPLEFLWYLEETKSKLYKFMVPFCGWWVKKLKMNDWHSSYYLNCALESIIDYRAEEIADDFFEAALLMLRDAGMYGDLGMGELYLNRIEKEGRGFAARKNTFTASLNRTKLDYREDFYRAWILDGIKLMERKDARTLRSMQFDYEFAGEEIDGDPVSVDDLFIIVWGSDDCVVTDCVEHMNMTFQEYGSFTPMEWHIVDGQVKKPYVHSDWPNKLRDWIMRGCHLMDHDVAQYLKECAKKESVDMPADIKKRIQVKVR